MVIRFTKWAICALLLLLVAGCSDGDKETISLSKESIELSPTTRTASFHVGSNTQWTVTVSGGDWLKASPTKGEGDATVTLTAEEIETATDRTAEVTVRGADVFQTLTVTQTGIPFVTDCASGKLEFDAAGTPIRVKVTSKTAWDITCDANAAWCKASPASGEPGETTVVFTPDPFTSREPRAGAMVSFNYGNSVLVLVASQELPNSAPSAPELLQPADGATDVALLPQFRWTASTDPDGDEVLYDLMLSANGGSTWSAMTGLTAVQGAPRTILEKNTAYLWKVVAYDTFGASAESGVRSFVTGDSGGYADGDCHVVQYACVSGARPVHLVVMGDGFIQEDFIEGGAFDQAADRAIEAFFAVEPYPTYRDYFQVTKVAAYSNERGATVQEAMPSWGISAQVRDTRFKTTLEGGNSTGISGNNELAQSYAKKVDGVSGMDDVSILMIVNINAYAGTCWQYFSGVSVAYCPMGDGIFEKVVSHECGGHGFGRLLDEYRVYASQVSSEDRAVVELWRKEGYNHQDGAWCYGANISFTSSPDEVHWKHYMNDPEYPGYGGLGVGLFEGCFLYSYGVWRPEYNSCMNDNILYYNAPSREAIVRRIKNVAGETFDMGDFRRKDVVRTYNGTRAPEWYPPLAPPVRVNK